MMDWNDYRLVLAVARAGGLPGAAELLGVTISTVYRRLDRVESVLGVRLFDRLRSGYQSTDAGHELIVAAERMEQEALAGDRAVTGRDQQLSGTLRVTASEVLATFFLSRHIPEFCSKHPDLFVDIISDNRRLSLADREADVALRLGRPKEETLVARRIGALHWGIYASPEGCERYGMVSELSELEGADIISWESSPAANRLIAWVDMTVPDAKIPYRSTSLITIAALAAAGKALAPLPCLLGSVWPGLERVVTSVSKKPVELWIATHQDLRHNARVRALLDHLTTAAHTDRDLFEGKLNQSILLPPVEASLSPSCTAAP